MNASIDASCDTDIGLHNINVWVAVYGLSLVIGNLMA